MNAQQGFMLPFLFVFLSSAMLLPLKQLQSIVLLKKTLEQAIAMESVWEEMDGALDLSQPIFPPIHREVLDKGVFACIQRNINGSLYSTRHFDLQIWHERFANQVLRARVALPEARLPCEQDKVRLIHAERLSYLMYPR